MVALLFVPMSLLRLALSPEALFKPSPMRTLEKMERGGWRRKCGKSRAGWSSKEQ